MNMVARAVVLTCGFILLTGCPEESKDVSSAEIEAAGYKAPDGIQNDAVIKAAPAATGVEEAPAAGVVLEPVIEPAPAPAPVVEEAKVPEPKVAEKKAGDKGEKKAGKKSPPKKKKLPSKKDPAPELKK